MSSVTTTTARPLTDKQKTKIRVQVIRQYLPRGFHNKMVDLHPELLDLYKDSYLMCRQILQGSRVDMFLIDIMAKVAAENGYSEDKTAEMLQQINTVSQQA